MAVVYRQLVMTTPLAGYAGQGWGASYFGAGAAGGVAPVYQEVVSRIRIDWTAALPSPAFHQYNPNGWIEGWWTSWAWLRPGRANVRLRATLNGDQESFAQAEARIVQYSPAGSDWTASLLASLLGAAGTAASAVDTKATVDFPSTGWYLFAVAFRCLGSVRRQAPIQCALDWCYPGLSSWRSVEGYFLHPTFLYPAVWPNGLDQPLGNWL